MVGTKDSHRIILTNSSITEDGNVVVHGQYCDDEDTINHLMDNIKAKNDSFQKLKDIEIGEMCLALFAEDGSWYRGVVNGKSENNYSVEFIDYGNIQRTSIQDLREIPENFRNLEPQAHCFLLDPQGGPVNPAGAGVFTTAVTDVINDEYLYAEVEIDVIQVTSQSIIVCSDSITQSLVEMGVIDLNKPYKRLVESKTSEKSFLGQEKYVVGQKINTVLSCVEPDGSFYCYNTANEHLLNNQMDALYEFCEGHKLQVLAEPSVGKLCCAAYSVDGNWYRAEILSKRAGKALVRFIDYGNTDTCVLSSLLPLGKEFRNMPVQAICCSLSGSHKKEKLARILNSYKDKNIVMEFMNLSVSPYVVRLYDRGVVVGLSRGIAPPTPCKEKQTVGPAETPYLASYKHISISLGSSKRVILKDTSNVKSIWCVLAENMKDLEKLHEDTNEIYSRISSADYDFQPDHSDLNRPCLVLDIHDKRWYRSKLLSPAGPGQYKVLYVDCGRIQIVKLDAIRIISDSLLRLPAFAIRFTITAILSVSGNFLPLERCSPLMPSLIEKSFVAVFNSYDQGKDLYFAELHDVGHHIRLSLSPVKSGIPKANVQLNIELPIRITSVDDPDCVWVQLIDYQADLIILTGKLNAYYNAIPQQALVLKDVHRGQICCMKSFKTKNWCRGEVAHFYDDMVEVKFVDFGYIEATRMSDVKVLMPEFMLLPSQAVCCRLHNLKPAGLRWCNGSVWLLKEFVTKAGVTGRFIGKTGSIYSAEIYVTSKEERILLGEKLVNEGLAGWIGQKLPRMATNPEPTKPILDGQPILQTASLPGPRVFYNNPGFGLIGVEIPVIVCDSSPSPSDFFILPRNSGLQRTYDKLARELKIYLAAEPANIAEVYVGMPCVCIIGRECYRAAVVSEEKTTNPLVFLVDFGEEKRVHLSGLRNISAEHINCVPPIAIRCTMLGIVEPKNQVWSGDAMVKFLKYCKETTKDLVCTIYGCVTDGSSQFFMAKLATPFQDLAKDLVDSADCRFVLPIGKMPPPFSLKSFIYSNLGSGIGKNDHFYITHIESVDLFYTQLASKFNVVADVMDKVQEYCSNFKLTKLLSPRELAFSPPCFVKYDDERWYRAHYTSPLPHSPRHVNVFLVDYGNLVTVPLTNVISFHYTSGLAEVPIQAIPCSLSELVVPIPDLQKSESILSEMRSKLLRRQLPGIVTGCTNGKFHLDLFVGEQRVNDQITGNVSPVASTVPLPNAESNEIDNDPLLKGKFSEIENISPKTVHSVYISDITDPDHFHVRLESLEGDFNACTAKVDGFYTAIRRQDYVVRSLQNRDIVCAKHPATLQWCRALVTDAESRKPTHVLVEFVDFGDREYVSVEDDTKKLIRSMLRWPRMAISCQLVNIVPLGKSWEPRNVEYFINTCRAVHCRVRFNTFHVAQRVWAIDMKIKGKNVAHMMVEKNNGKFVKAPSSSMSNNIELFIKTRPVDSWAPGVTKQVYISHVESVNGVYLQLVESEASLKVMMSKLNDPTLNLKTAVKVDSQQSYASKYEEDGRYYRSNVVSSHSNIHHVILTDYGYSSSVKIADLRLLPKEFTILPEQAVKCSVTCPPGLHEDLIVTKLKGLAVDGSVSVHAKSLTVEAGSSSLHVELYILGKDGVKTGFVDLCRHENDKTDENGQKTDHAERSLKHLHLRTGIDTKVYLSQFDEPDKIWLQLSEYSAELDSLMAEIDAFCNGDAAQKLKIFDSGAPCLAKYHDDDSWYRGEIMRMDISKNEAQIHFIDYGTSDFVKIGDMREINEGFLQLPKQAVRCKLFNLQGIQKWKPSDSENFIERVSDVELTAQFYPCENVTELLEVKLTYPCGKSLNDEWNETLRNRSPTANGANGSGDTIPVDQSTASSNVPEQHIVTDRGDHVIVENFLPPSASIDFNTSADVRSTPTLKPDATLQKLSVQPGMIEDGYVSHCDDPGRFFIQFAKYEHELAQIGELSAKSAEYPLERSVEAGRYYVVKSPDDGEWYRGKCAEMKDGKCIVFFSDYGNTAQVEESDLKQMQGDLKSFAVQAVECQLHDLIPKTGSWGDTTDFFLEMVLDKDLKIEFVELAESDRWNVKLNIGDMEVRKQILEKHCLEQRESKINLEHFPQSFVQTGSILCVKVVKVTQDTLVAILNMPFGLLQDAIKDFVENLEGDLQNRLLSACDLDAYSVYLIKSSGWHCVKVIDTDGGIIEGIDFSTKEIVNLNHESLFLRPDDPIINLAENMLVECSLEEIPNVGLKYSALCGEIVVAKFLSRNEQRKWNVKILPIGQSFEKNAVTSEAVTEVLVTDTDETGNRMSEKQWTCELIRDLSVLFSRGIQLFNDCPETLLHLRNVLLQSRNQILSGLTEHEKNLLNTDAAHTTCTDERLKRCSIYFVERHHGKELPSQAASLSDSVFLTDTEDSSDQPVFAGKKQLTSFKSYCSTNSSVVEDDVTLGADTIEESLSNEEGEVESHDVRQKDLPRSISSSLLDLLTPVTVASGDTDEKLLRVHGKENTLLGGDSSRRSCNAREKLLDGAVNKLVGEVFRSIEIEDEEEEIENVVVEAAGCTIPESIDDANIQPNSAPLSCDAHEKLLDGAANELVGEVFRSIDIEDEHDKIEDLVVEEAAGCIIPESIDDANIQPNSSPRSCNAREKLLDGATNKLVEEVFRSIEFEDEEEEIKELVLEEGTGCTTPESLGDANIQPNFAPLSCDARQEKLLDGSINELVGEVFHSIEIEDEREIEDVVEEAAGCNIPEYIDDANIQPNSAPLSCDARQEKLLDGSGNEVIGEVVRSIGIEDEQEEIKDVVVEEATGCSIPQSLDDASATNKLVGEVFRSIEIEDEQDKIEILVVEEAAGCSTSDLLEEQGNGCNILDSLNDANLQSRENARIESINQSDELHVTGEEGAAGCTIPDSLNKIPALGELGVESLPFVQMEKEIVESLGGVPTPTQEEVVIECVESTNHFPIFQNSVVTDSFGNFTLDDAEGNLQDLLNSSNVSIEDVDYYSAEESLVETPPPESDKEAEKSVFPLLPIHAVNSAMEALRDDCLPEYDRYKSCTPPSSEDEVTEKKDVDGDMKLEESCSRAKDEVENRIDSDQQQDGRKEIDYSGSVVLHRAEELLERLERLRNMIVEDCPPQEEEEESVAKEESSETENPDVTRNNDALGSRNILADQCPDQTSSTEVCSVPHQHQRFYICCLPKMQLEVGDSYQVLYMNSKDPHDIQLQFDFGTDTEEWRKAVGNINTQESVDKLNASEIWQPDMMCLVQCLADMSWERGHIITKDDGTWEVELIDYGEVMKASIQQLREIPEHLCLYPRQSARCSLFEIAGMKEHSAGGKWDENINKHLRDLLFCSSLKVEVVEICESPAEEKYIVKLFLVQEDGQTKNIGKMLIDAGLAQSRTLQKEATKTEDDEWSTATDTAWETLIHPNVSRSDLMHSSNLDLSNIEEAFGEGVLVDAEIRESRDVSGIKPCRKEAIKPSEEELHAVAREIRRKVIAGALIIAGFECDDRPSCEEVSCYQEKTEI